MFVCLQIYVGSFQIICMIYLSVYEIAAFRNANIKSSANNFSKFTPNTDAGHCMKASS